MLGLRKNRKAEADDASAAPLLGAPTPGGPEPPVDDYDTASSWAEEENQLSREKLDMIKARTMHEMVEEVELQGGPCKLLFLTNAQAELLAHSDASLQKMLDALEVPKPQLVINLLNSSGFRQHIESYGEGGLDRLAAADLAGFVSGRTPFLTKEEEEAAERRIDRFMADILIPLAAQTNAVVIAYPVANCILSVCLMRMYALHRSKWGKRPPFTIISAGSVTNSLYDNGDLNACWRDVRRQSRHWRARDKKLIDLAHQLAKGDRTGSSGRSTDFDPNCSCIITTDMIESRKEASWDKGPFNRLLTALVRYLGSSLPALSLKTGASSSRMLSQKGSAANGLDIALDSALSGSPVLFLDVRERPRLEAADRLQLIDAAKAALGAHCDALVEAGVADSFVCSTIAYAREVLYGMPGGAGERRPDAAADRRLAPLHAAIREASDDGAGSKDEGAQGLRGATPQQAAELAAWLAHRYFRDAFAVLTDRAQREARGETYQSLYGGRITAAQLWTEALLASPSFSSVSLCDQDRAAGVVSRLVRLDRLPKQNPLEGLMLLQEAWKSHDIAVHLANYYKGLSKLLFASQLLLVWAVTVCTALGGAFGGEEEGDKCEGGRAEPGPAPRLPFFGQVAYSDAAFFLAGAVSLSIAIDGLLNAKGRWRQLRAAAGSLESAIWCYRTRVGDFELAGAGLSSLGPEMRLRQTLVAWRRNLMTGGDLKQSGFSRAYPPRIFTHHQFPESGPLSTEDADDHYSPVQPQKYVEVRILPSIAFYEQRTPWYARESFVFKAVIVLSTLAASVLSRYQLMVWVVGITAGASGVTSWQEYSDVGRKTMRYTHAAVELENLLAWWKSTSEVERASRAAITQLIHTAEGVIAEERLAWVSTISSKPDAAPSEKEKPGAGEEP